MVRMLEETKAKVRNTSERWFLIARNCQIMLGVVWWMSCDIFRGSLAYLLQVGNSLRRTGDVVIQSPAAEELAQIW